MGVDAENPRNNEQDMSSEDDAKSQTLCEKSEAPLPVLHEPSRPTFVPPDGGLQAWVTVVGGFLFQFCSFGMLNALGIFQLEYEDVILTSNSTSSISWILTFQIFLMFFLSQMAGVLVDIFGPRIVLIPSSVLCIVGVLTLSWATTYWQIFLAQGLCFGIGAAGAFMPAFITIGQYFRRKRALAVGIMASGSSLGGVIFPIFFSQLFDRIGFGPTLRWTALFLAITLLIANTLFYSPIEPKGWKNGKRAVIDLGIFKRLNFLLFTIGAFFFYWGMFAPFNYLPVFAERSKVSASIALYTVSLTNATSILGRILPSQISDSIGHMLVLTVMAFLSGISTFALWLPFNYHDSLAGVVIFALVYGFVSGGFISLMSPCVIDLCLDEDYGIQDIGGALGAYMCAISFAALTGLPIQGAIYDSEPGDYAGLIVFAGTMMVFGSAIIGLVYFRHERGRWVKGKGVVKI